VAVTTAALEADRTGTPPPPLAAGSDANGLLEVLSAHRVVMHVTPHADELGLPAELGAALRDMRRRQLASGLANVADTATVSAALHRAGIDHLFVKGVALTAAVGRQPALRGGGDIDVWVRPTDVGAACEVIETLGWRHRGQNLHGTDRGPLVRWTWKECCLTRPRHTSVDLHWRVVEDQREVGYDFDEAWAASIPLPAIGPTVRTLSPSHALAHVAAHARRDIFALLRQLVDVALLADRCDDGELWRLGATDRTVRLAVTTAANIAPWLAGTVPADPRTAHQSSRAWAHCLSQTHRADRHNHRRGLDRVASSVRRHGWMVSTGPGSRFVVPQTGRFLAKGLLTHPLSPLRPLARHSALVRRWYWCEPT